MRGGGGVGGGQAPVVSTTFPAGYGLHVFGLLLPFPPAPALWAVMALDVGATLWARHRPDRRPLLAGGAVTSAYLAAVGVFSVGPAFAALFLVQAALLFRRLRKAPARR
jgi:hypothetical protein